MRTIELTGRLAANAERKMTTSGKEYLSFRIANNEFNDKDEQGNQKTYWFNVRSFNARHLSLSTYLTKGSSIIVCGDYQDRIYQTNDGRCEIGRDIIANAIYFNSNGGGTNGNETAGGDKSVASASPKVEKSVPSRKPTTAEIEIPSATSSSDDIDDLPF